MIEIPWKVNRLAGAPCSGGDSGEGPWLAVSVVGLHTDRREAQMTRSVLAAAVALIATATFFTSAAEACISCEYVPEVVNTPVRGKAYQKKRVVVAAKPAEVRVPKKRIAKPAPVTKDVAAARTEPTEAKTEETTATRPIPTAALLETRPTAARTPEVVADLGCKKFFATIGQTLTVPCE
jgi:hypothetical protein